MTCKESTAGRESTKCRLCGEVMVAPEELSILSRRLDLFYHWWFQHGLKDLNKGSGDASFASDMALGIHDGTGSGFTCPVCQECVPGTGSRNLDAWLTHLHTEGVDFDQHLTYMLLVGAC